jgi:hypothetical protein
MATEVREALGISLECGIAAASSADNAMKTAATLLLVPSGLAKRQLLLVGTSSILTEEYLLFS